MIKKLEMLLESDLIDNQFILNHIQSFIESTSIGKVIMAELFNADDEKLVNESLIPHGTD